MSPTRRRQPACWLEHGQLLSSVILVQGWTMITCHPAQTSLATALTAEKRTLLTLPEVRDELWKSLFAGDARAALKPAKYAAF